MTPAHPPPPFIGLPFCPLLHSHQLMSLFSHSIFSSHTNFIMHSEAKLREKSESLQSSSVFFISVREWHLCLFIWQDGSLFHCLVQLWDPNEDRSQSELKFSTSHDVTCCRSRIQCLTRRTWSFCAGFSVRTSPPRRGHIRAALVDVGLSGCSGTRPGSWKASLSRLARQHRKWINQSAEIKCGGEEGTEGRGAIWHLHF